MKKALGIAALLLLAFLPFASAQPVLTSVTPDAGKAGDSVTISGSGFAQFYPENLVTFNGRKADVTAGSSGSLTVTVPVGATTGPIEVRVGVFLSNGFPFTISPAGAFLNLSGININPANFHAFVSDSGAPVASSLIELDPFTLVGGEWMRTSRMGIANIRGLPLSADNRFYFSNASLNNFNQGTMSYWDLSTMVFGNWPRSAGTADTDPVACVAMGASPAHSGFLFFADRRNNHIRRLGNLSRDFYAVGLSFAPDFSGTVAGFRGLAFDNNGAPGTTDFGDLYVSSGGTIVRVTQNNPIGDPDNTTSTTVVTGLSTPAALYFDDTRTLHVADPGANRISLYHSPTGTFEHRLTGLSAPRMATLGQTGGAEIESRLYIAEPTRVVEADDQRIDLTPRENIQALISNCPVPAATPGCVGVPYPSPYQTQPRQVQITATLHPPRAGVTIFFDLEDPPDTSPYGTPAQNDNLGGPGSLSVTSGATDADGHVTAVLTITDRFAGDNYRVRARLTAGGPLIATTGIITAWKRVFVEQDKMFRQPGQYLTADSPPDPGPTTIAVADTSRFQIGMPGDRVYVFDSVNDTPVQANVIAKTETTLTLDQHLDITYFVVNRAYVGREADGFYDADLSVISRTFDQPFVEFRVLDAGSNPVPYAALADLDDTLKRDMFSAIWFKNGQIMNDSTNYVHYIACEQVELAVYGKANPLKNWVYIAVKEIEMAFPIADRPQVNRSTSNHEAVHQWSFPDEMDAPANHPAWCNPLYCAGSVCILHVTHSLTDGIDEIEVAELLTRITLPMAIRRALDPI